MPIIAAALQEKSKKLGATPAMVKKAIPSRKMTKRSTSLTQILEPETGAELTVPSDSTAQSSPSVTPQSAPNEKKVVSRPSERERTSSIIFNPFFLKLEDQVEILANTTSLKLD